VRISRNCGRDTVPAGACVWAADLVRIVREAIINVRKHSNASHFSIELVEHGRRLRGLVHDNGRGLTSSGRRRLEVALR
jgi:signal transduction histidine kinase